MIGFGTSRAVHEATRCFSVLRAGPSRLEFSLSYSFPHLWWRVPYALTQSRLVLSFFVSWWLVAPQVLQFLAACLPTLSCATGPLEGYSGRRCFCSPRSSSVRLTSLRFIENRCYNHKPLWSASTSLTTQQNFLMSRRISRLRPNPLSAQAAAAPLACKTEIRREGLILNLLDRAFGPDRGRARSASLQAESAR